MTGRTESPSPWDPEWPTDDPAALMSWLEEGGVEALGRNVNAWLGVIFYASSQILAEWSAPERRAFRDAALAAIDAGRRAGALPQRVWVEKEIYARMSYIRASTETLPCLRAEMARVLDTFLSSLPMDIAAARERSIDWRDHPERWGEQDVKDISALRNTKTLLHLIEPGTEFLSPDQRAILQPWQDISGLLP